MVRVELGRKPGLRTVVQLERQRGWRSWLLARRQVHAPVWKAEACRARRGCRGLVPAAGRHESSGGGVVIPLARHLGVSETGQALLEDAQRLIAPSCA